MAISSFLITSMLLGTFLMSNVLQKNIKPVYAVGTPIPSNQFILDVLLASQNTAYYIIPDYTVYGIDGTLLRSSQSNGVSNPAMPTDTNAAMYLFGASAYSQKEI